VVIVSYVFDVGDETIWSPSLRTGRLYVGLTDCLAELEGRPTGLSAISSDMYEIDPKSFEILVRAIFEAYFSTDNHVYRSQLRGWLLTSLALLKRIGSEITPANDDERLFLESVDEYAKAMPS
jgi:hypothetical protein